MAAALDLEPESLIVNERIYDAGVQTLLDAIRSLDDRRERLMLVGHNPGLTDVANLLAGASIDRIRTCAMAELRLDVASWADVHAGAATLVALDSPKDYAD